MELSVTQVIAWMRAKAATLIATADMLEGKTPQNERPAKPKPANNRTGSEVTIEDLEAAIKIKGGRPGKLAERLGTTPEHILSLLNVPGCSLKIGERGWIKSKSEVEKVM